MTWCVELSSRRVQGGRDLGEEQQKLLSGPSQAYHPQGHLIFLCHGPGLRAPLLLDHSCGSQGSECHSSKTIAWFLMLCSCFLSIRLCSLPQKVTSSFTTLLTTSDTSQLWFSDASSMTLPMGAWCKQHDVLMKTSMPFSPNNPKTESCHLIKSIYLPTALWQSSGNIAKTAAIFSSVESFSNNLWLHSNPFLSCIIWLDVSFMWAQFTIYQALHNI